VDVPSPAGHRPPWEFVDLASFPKNRMNSAIAAPGTTMSADLVRSQLVNRLGHVSSGFQSFSPSFSRRRSEIQALPGGPDFLHPFRFLLSRGLVPVHFQSGAEHPSPFGAASPTSLSTQSMQVLSMNSRAVRHDLAPMIADTVSTVAAADSKKAIMFFGRRASERAAQ